MKFIQFQRDDLSRLALVNGAILGWDTGLGKTLAEFAWPLLKVGWFIEGGVLMPNRPGLLVVPGDLQARAIEQAWKFFRIRPVPLPSLDEFATLSRTGLKPRFYMTSYTQLGVNGTRRGPGPDKMGIEVWLQQYGVGPRHLAAWFAERDLRFAQEYGTLKCDPGATHSELQARFDTLRKNTHDGKWGQFLDAAFIAVRGFHCHLRNPTFAQLPRDHQRVVARRFALDLAVEINDVGTERRGIRCVAKPSLSDVARRSFAFCVVDEGVRIKGELTRIGLAVRQIEADYRMVLTATAIKNRLPDIFHLAHWVAGAGLPSINGRFPYHAEDADVFAEEYCMSERNLTAEKETRRRYRKLTPQVTNIHRCWKLLAPIICRRRKDDIGRDIVAKHRHVVRVPMGRKQADTYRYHLESVYQTEDGDPNPGGQLQALRQVACAPNSDHLLDRQASVKDRVGHARSGRPFTPKIAAVLNLVHQVLCRHEQIVIFSAFLDPLDVLSRYLGEAGVRHLKLDGRMTPARRGEASARFARGPVKYAGGRPVEELIPVLLAGEECMAEGHDWPYGRNVALVSFAWAYDKYEQCINRVHRVNSPEDVHVWSFLCEGTVDLRHESDIHEKSNASDLVLDGRLLATNPEELSVHELLRHARKDFDTGSRTLCEDQLLAEWPDLRTRLREASGRWGRPESNIIPFPANALPAPGRASAHPWRDRLRQQNFSPINL